MFYYSRTSRTIHGKRSSVTISTIGTSRHLQPRRRPLSLQPYRTVAHDLPPLFFPQIQLLALVNIICVVILCLVYFGLTAFFSFKHLWYGEYEEQGEVQTDANGRAHHFSEERDVQAYVPQVRFFP